jgi:Co/Zn/Cd efflux system component
VADCCAITASFTERQRGVLRIVLAINVAMFLAESTAGILAQSTALLADSVDMLGDAIVYGFSLHVVARGPVWQARGALLKGVLMAAFGTGVLVEALVKLVAGTVPVAPAMGATALLALAANVTCLALLWPRRADDVNMRSAWTCSLNDVAGNVGVMVAAAGVALTGASWPDIVVGVVIAALFMTSAVKVVRTALEHRRRPSCAPTSVT